MIYLQNTTDAQIRTFFRNGQDLVDRTLGLDLFSTTDRKTTSQDCLAVLQSDLYVAVSVTLPENLPDGEYEYKLRDEGNVICTGLLCIQSPETAQVVYNKTIEYEQYEY